MRFFEDGPDIPDSLVEARELGEVVFFCGAGLSAPVGLPSFDGLADKLIAQLAATDARIARDKDERLDRVFNAMVKEFGSTAVHAEMTRALRTPRHADLRYHRAALDLSRGVDGAAKIVTTNFDLLFEAASRGLQTYVPPALPDLTQIQPIQGVVYLHGRLSRAGRPNPYVITSADFGRAYLAEGWAARFVRELRERYTIVLLGYSANDMAMQYLLEGLNSREGVDYRTQLYAFAPEGGAAVDEAWRDKGVTTIPYEPRDSAHGGLWDSLFAWAEAARNPDAWRASLVTLAQSQPAKLRPHERGLVAHLVGSRLGASAFASADPPPPAEWMCVLDVNMRYRKPDWETWEEKILVDPLDHFGLDNDPPRPEPQPGQGFEAPGDDLIRWKRGDQQWPDRQRLSGYQAPWTNQLPGRLSEIGRWFGKVMDQPAAVWWAVRNNLPHPGLLNSITNRMSRGVPMPPPAQHFWDVYLEVSRSQAEDYHDLRGYELSSRIDVAGWGNFILRELERILVPFFRIEPPLMSGPVPPRGDWDSLSLRDLATIKVKVSKLAPNLLQPPPEFLPDVLVLLRKSLQRMAAMIDDSSSLYWRTPTLHPTGDRGETLDVGAKSGYFLTFKELFDKLVEQDIGAAKVEVAQWDSGDRIFFAKLFLYATGVPRLVEPSEAARNILAMPDDVFWNSDVRRELLFALRAKWSEFALRDRGRIERKLVAGPPSYEDEPAKDHRIRRGATAASCLRWLELNGRVLSPPTKSKLPKLMAADERWSDSWAASADDSHGSWGGMIERVTDSQGLEAAPLSELLDLAQQLSTDDHRQLRDYRPFDGVVEKAPLRALSALRINARKGDVAGRFWHVLVDKWPDGAATRLNILMGHVLARLPDPLFKELRHGISRWAQKHLPALIGERRSAGFAVFDAIVGRYMNSEPDVLHSGVGFSSIGGVPQEKSEVSVMKAINAPGGQLAQILLGLLGTRKRREAMPRRISTRLDLLLKLPGDGGGHAAAVCARQFVWLAHWFPEWGQAFASHFDLADPLSEATWHGFAGDHNNLVGNVRLRLKPILLALLKGEAGWELDKEERGALIQCMIMWTYAPKRGRPTITYAEARRVLMEVSDEDRAKALGLVARSMSDEMWASFIKPFILDAWPRQLRYQSEASSRQFAAIAEKGGDKYPEVVRLILPYLRPAAHLDTFAFRTQKKDEGGEGYSERFPAETLDLFDALIGDDPQTMPWNLGEIVETIAIAAPALRQSNKWRRLKGMTQ